MQGDEVRYHMLRPAQIVARRKACPVAYVPIGNLEWHGVHNPLGADTLQAEGIAIRCARKGGGLVFPALYYGESRVEALMEALDGHRQEIAAEMELPADNFLPDRHPFSAAEQAANYNKLLLHILCEVESLGFEVAVLAPGHYPLIDHTRAAVLQFNQQRRKTEPKTLAWTFVDYLLLTDQYENAGDHGGGWETSHLMALNPPTVDLSQLPPVGEHIVGVGSRRPPQESTAAFGEEIIDAAVEVAVNEVAHRLAHPERYRRHGCSLLQGLWKHPDGGCGS
jgi:creatinine amidohydrolase